MDTSSPANACINREWINENQLGCTRQIENIVSQLGGEWPMMEGRSGLQEDIGAYRFQLAYAGLAIALWHFVSLSRAPQMLICTGRYQHCGIRLNRIISCTAPTCCCFPDPIITFFEMPDIRGKDSHNVH